MSDFLGSPAVTLAYYLFTFFGIEAALVIAWGQWQRSDSFRARRLTIVFIGLTLLRLMLIFLVMIGRTSGEVATVWIPPFERVLAISSLGFLLWGFTPLFREKPFFGTTLLAVNTSFAFIFYFLAVNLWIPANGGNLDFNQTGWEIFFLSWQIVLALFGAINCAMKLDDERIYALFSFVTLLAGYIAHFMAVLGNNYSLPHIPIWVRMAELIAYPLFAVAVYQGAIQSLRARSQELQSLSKHSLEQIRGLISLFEATRQISSSLELSSVLDGAAESVANAIGADQTAIALPENETDLSQLRLVAIYNPARKGRGEAVSFPLNEQQVIKHALKRKYQVQIDEYQDNNQIRMLFAVMGAKDVGPLLVQPLLKAGEPIGVLIAGNADSKRVFTESEAQLCKTLADQIAVSIEHAREYMSVSAKSQQLSWTLRNQEMEAGKRRAAMETELKKSREEVILFSQRLQQVEAETEATKQALQQAQERAGKLERAIEKARVEIERARQKEKELIALAGETDKYKKQLADLDVEQKKLHQQVEELEQEAIQVERLNEALEASHRRSRKLARALKRARETVHQTALVPALNSSDAVAKLEDLSCGVIIGDANDKINKVNAAARHLLGRPNSLIDSDLNTIFEDDQWRQALQQLRSTDERVVTTTLKVGDIVLRATISPMVSYEGNGQGGTVTILYDVTAEAESQQARDEFVASLSQELRTPMTSITGYTDLLLGESVGTIGEMQRKFLQRIKANIERMNSMLNDLIGVTAIDAGQLEIRPVVIDMAEIIEDGLINARAQLEEKEITLNVNLLDEMPLVEVDPDSVRQILSNLLGNAIKATPVGESIEVFTSLHYENGLDDPDMDEAVPYLKVSIRDSGGGIAAKDLGRVFERFYRAERPLIEGLGETGVGLAIVKSLVEAHGGRVWVESEIGEGSTFHFILAVNEQLNDPWLEVDIPPLDLNSDQPDAL